MKFLSLFSFFLLLIGCSTSPIEKKTLRLAFQTTPVTLDPKKSGDFTSSTLICLLYEGLTRCSPESGVELALADQVQISPDGCSYTFHLRSAFWTDGQPVTAFDFEQAWKQIADPAFPALSAHLLFPIKNGKQCIQGDLPPSVLGVHALDAKILSVELENPAPYFLALTAFPLFFPTPSHRQSDHSHAIISNGPFLLKSFSPQQEILLEKNCNFWNAEHIFLDAIHISLIGNETTALRLFEKGELDWLGAPLSMLPPDAIPSLQDQGHLQSTPMSATTFLTFNIQSPLFQNFHLRQAFSLALDREKLVNELGLIGQIPAKTLLPPSLSVVGSSPYFVCDPTLAKQHFDLALEELGIGVEELSMLTLYFKTGQTEKQLAQILQKEWKEIFGLTIRVEQSDHQAHLTRLHQKEYEIALSSWIAQFHDPISILDRFRLRANPKNIPSWEDSEYQALLDSASLFADPNARNEALKKAEELLTKELPLVPIYHWSGLSISHPRVEGLKTTPSGGILFEWCSLH